MSNQVRNSQIGTCSWRLKTLAVCYYFCLHVFGEMSSAMVTHSMEVDRPAIEWYKIMCKFISSAEVHSRASISLHFISFLLIFSNFSFKLVVWFWGKTVTIINICFTKNHILFYFQIVCVCPLIYINS